MKIPLSKSLKILEWILFIGLCIFSANFMQNSYSEYQQRITGMAQSFREITDLPVVTICLNGKVNYQYQLDFHLHYQAHFGSGWQKLSVDKMEHFETVSETILLQRLSYDCVKLSGTLKSSLKKAVLPSVISLKRVF